MVMSLKYSEVSTGANELDLSNAAVDLVCFTSLEEAAEL